MMAKNNDNLPIKQPQGEFLVYAGEDGQIKLEVRLEDETVWLSQRLMAELFSVTVPTINEHLRNIFHDKELSQDSVIRKFRTTAPDGKNYSTKHYKIPLPAPVPRDVDVEARLRVFSPGRRPE
jgi:hypothetical protein